MKSLGASMLLFLYFFQKINYTLLRQPLRSICGVFSAVAIACLSIHNRSHPAPVAPGLLYWSYLLNYN